MVRFALWFGAFGKAMKQKFFYFEKQIKSASCFVSLAVEIKGVKHLHIIYIVGK